MFDISTVNKRYFEIKLTVTDDDEKEHILQLEVEPAKLKTLRQLLAVSKAEDAQAIDDLYIAIQKLLSKNRGRKKVPIEYVEALDVDEMQAILLAYFDWLSNTKKNDPN